MMFLKFFCCKETLQATINIGEIRNKENLGNPVLEVHISLSLGSIRSATDFLYLQPQIDNPIHRSIDKSLANTSTASSHRNTNTQVGGPEDKEPLPKRLREVKKDRVILIEKNSALCDSSGMAHVDLQIEKGKYKLYYLRIENEQRILSNSRLEVLGSSSAFSVNKMTSDDNHAKGQSNKNDEQLMYEESYSYTSQDSCAQYKKQKRSNSPYYEESSSLDSAVLMRQIQSQQIFNSQSQSVYSSDQTRVILQSQSVDGDSTSYHNPVSHHFDGNPSQYSQYSEAGNSSYSNNSSATYVVRKDNDEAMIMTHSNNGSQSSRHKRGNNIQSVLEDISNQQNGRNSRNTLKRKTTLNSKKVIKGKENRTSEYYLQSKQDMMEVKSHSFTSGAINSRRLNSRKKGIQIDLNKINNDDDDELDVRYINDIDSLVPPRYNPDTRTYFKCSIYSPSNRLYTVNEEANSTYSDVGGADQFSSSLMNSGYRRSSGRSKITAKINHRSSAANLEKNCDNEQDKIDEESDDDDAGNISESMIMPSTPRHKIAFYMKSHEKQEKNQSQTTTGAHTRNNSSRTQSKVQSLKGSIVINKPFSSQFSSIVTSSNQPLPKQSEVDKRIVNNYLRGTFTGVLPGENGIQMLKRQTDNESDELGNDINQYMHPLPGSFVCTGGTEFQYENCNSIAIPNHNNQTYYSNTSQKSQSSNGKPKKGTISIEKSVVKSRSSASSDMQITNTLQKEEGSPLAYYDENNRKVLIISKDPKVGNKVQHCIQWDEGTDAGAIGKAIEDVLLKVKSASPRTSNISMKSVDHVKTKSEVTSNESKSALKRII